MKRLMILALICSFPIAAPAHPGKTDKYGGHKCIKDCEEWKLYYAEYHLHDKDGKPIRISKRQKIDKHRIQSAATEPELSVMSEPARSVETVTVTVYKYISTVNEEAVPFNPLLWALLVLLLLLLILRLNRKRSENAKSKI